MNPQESTAYHLTGLVFGHLTVQSRATASKWACRCTCGRQRTVFASCLRTRAVRDCGCGVSKQELIDDAA